MIPHVLDTLPFRIPANSNIPAARRRILEQWHSQAPENDSDIFCRQADTEKPRLEHLEEDCKLLKTWRNLRSDAESDGLGTNWMSVHEPLAADNDDEAPAHRPLPLRDLDLTEDTAEALVRRLGNYVAEERPETILRRDEDDELYVAEQRTRLMLVGNADGEFERYAGTRFRAKPRSRKKLEAPGAVSRCGTAHFTGRDHRVDGLTEGTLCFRDSQRRLRPVDVDYDLRPLGNEERQAGKQNNERPPETRIPDTEDIVDARQKLVRLQAFLTPETVLVLDTAIRAQNFDEVGAAAGYSGDYAKKAGKRLTIAACKSLDLGLREISTKRVA